MGNRQATKYRGQHRILIVTAAQFHKELSKSTSCDEIVTVPAMAAAIQAVDRPAASARTACLALFAIPGGPQALLGQALGGFLQQGLGALGL